MEFSTQGFHWEGFFRSLQGDLMSFVGFCVFILFVLLVAHWVIKKAKHEIELQQMEVETVRKWVNGTALALIVIAVSILTWRAVTLASVDRMPRADVDKSAVYKQMEGLQQRPNQ